MNFIPKPILALQTKIFKDDILTQAAALALYTVFALPPLVILLLNFFSTLRLNLQKSFIEQVELLMGHDAATVLITIVESTTQSGAIEKVSIWSVTVLLLPASVIFAHMQSALNIVFEIEEKVSTQGSLMGLLVWVYYSSFIVLLGAEISYYFYLSREVTA